MLSNFPGNTLWNRKKNLDVQVKLNSLIESKFPHHQYSLRTWDTKGRKRMSGWYQPSHLSSVLWNYEHLDIRCFLPLLTNHQGVRSASIIEERVSGKNTLLFRYEYISLLPVIAGLCTMHNALDSVPSTSNTCIQTHASAHSQPEADSYFIGKSGILQTLSEKPINNF